VMVVVMVACKCTHLPELEEPLISRIPVAQLGRKSGMMTSTHAAPHPRAVLAASCA